jgi:hypothetical protein
MISLSNKVVEENSGTDLPTNGEGISVGSLFKPL